MTQRERAVDTLEKVLSFRPLPTLSDEPQRYEVQHARYHQGMGLIAYYPAWRRYVFTPTVRALYDPARLREVAEFIEGLEEGRRT